MMTDEELDSFEVAAKKMIETSCGPFASFYNEDFSKVILDLIAELRLVERQLDTLAVFLAQHQGRSVTYWREYARTETKAD